MLEKIASIASHMQASLLTLVAFLLKKIENIVVHILLHKTVKLNNFVSNTHQSGGKSETFY